MKRTSLAAAVACAVLGSPAHADFVEDSKATLNLRNMYYNRNLSHSDTRAGEASEWGQAFRLHYNSGFTDGTVGLGVDVFGQFAYRLDAGGRAGKADTSRTPGQMFPLDDGRSANEFSRLGLTGKARIGKTDLHIGTLMPRIPVLISNDSRLLAQTFEGAQITSQEVEGLTLLAGQLRSTKTRASSNDIDMRIGGSSADAGSNKFYYAGADYAINEDLTAQYYYANLENYYKQHFLGLVHNWSLPVGSLKTDLRYFYSSSDGKNASASGRAQGYSSGGDWASGDRDMGEVDNRVWSAQLSYNLGSHTFLGGYQQVSGNSDFPFLSQGDGSTAYLITNRQIGKFLSAGERTWVAEYAYDFAELGAPGLKAAITYLSADNIDAPGPDKREWERDFRVEYVVQDGVLSGMGLAWRTGTLRGNNDVDQEENQLIVTYSLPLF